MALIPQYEIPKYGAKPLDFSILYDAIGDIKAKRDKLEQEERLKVQSVQKKINELDPAASKFKMHLENATKDMDLLNDKVANYFTYDDKGKIKRDREQGTLSDKQTVDLMFDVKNLQTKFSKQKSDYEKASKFFDEAKKSPDKFDMKTVKNLEEDWDVTGEWSDPSAEQVIASVNPVEVFNDKLAKNVLGWEPEKTETLSKDGMKKITTIKGLTPEIQYKEYYNAAKQNVGVQKGLIDMMLTSGKTDEDIKAYYLGDLLGGDILKDKNIDGKSQEAIMNMAMESIDSKFLQQSINHVNTAIDNYRKTRKVDPTLAEAAINFGASNLKLHENIGKGRTIEAPNTDMQEWKLKEQYKDAHEKKKEEDKIEIPQTRVIQIPKTGMTFKNAVDLSTIPDTESQKRSLNHFVIPKGALKVLGGKNQEVLDKDGKATTLSDATSIEKSFKELNNQGDYMIDWYDKSADFMQIRAIDNKSGTYFIVPIRGNEYMLQKIGNFEQPSKTNTSKGRYD
jgi:hypothetical protein